jgi:6-phosphogluconolactonase
MRIEIIKGGAGLLADRAAVWVAEQIWAAVADRGAAHVAVSGGNTPTAMFGTLATLPVPWGAVHIWQVDERVAPDGDPDRNLVDLQAALLSKVPATPHLFDVTNPDLDAAMSAYARDLQQSCGGVLDVVHLGLGDDGHTASWPPGDPVVDVTDTDVARSLEYKGRVRLTLTVPAVNRAREIMFLVAGDDKARAVAALVDGAGTVPASHVRRDGTVVLLDEAAAGHLATVHAR